MSDSRSASDFYLFECGCGVKTFLPPAGGNLNECACSPEAKRATTTRTRLVRRESVLLEKALNDETAS